MQAVHAQAVLTDAIYVLTPGVDKGDMGTRAGEVGAVEAAHISRADNGDMHIVLLVY
mgnify:CR=1 FL=1